MSDLRTAARQALTLLELISQATTKQFGIPLEIVDNLKAALAEPVEPVAWIHTDPDMPRVKFLEWRENEPGYRGDWIKTPLYTAPPQRPAEPVQEQDIEDAIEAAYWHFDARRSGLNEWASAPQSDRDAFKAEARKLVRGYFPARQAQDTKREKLAVADAFIRGYWDGFNIGEREGRIEAEDAAQQAEPVQEPVAFAHINGTSDTKWHPPQRQPLTREQIHNLYLHMSGKSEGLIDAGGEADFPVLFARAVEEMHGIT